MQWAHDLEEVLQKYGIMEYAFPLVALFLINLGSVYSGRLLGLSHSEKTKNRIAVISILISCVLFIFDEISTNGIVAGIVHYLILAGTSIVLYTLIGKNLYKRIDSKLDKWIGDDGESAKDSHKDTDREGSKPHRDNGNHEECGSDDQDEDDHFDLDRKPRSRRKNKNSNINININNCENNCQ